MGGRRPLTTDDQWAAGPTHSSPPQLLPPGPPTLLPPRTRGSLYLPPSCPEKPVGPALSCPTRPQGPFLPPQASPLDPKPPQGQ